MSLRSGTLKSAKPLMELIFRAQVFRATTTSGPGINPKQTYGRVHTDLPCDVCPLKDEVVWSQAGQTNIYTHVIHFTAGTDVQERDIVRVTSSHALFGTTNQDFEVAERSEPFETVGFCRVYARSTAALQGL